MQMRSYRLRLCHFNWRSALTSIRCNAIVSAYLANWSHKFEPLNLFQIVHKSAYICILPHTLGVLLEIECLRMFYTGFRSLKRKISSLDDQPRTEMVIILQKWPANTSRANSNNCSSLRFAISKNVKERAEKREVAQQMIKVRIFGILTRSNFERTTRFPIERVLPKKKKERKKETW